MDCSFTTLAYRDTGYFSSIITDYLEGAPQLRPFYQHPVSFAGIEAAMLQRSAFPQSRQSLVNHLHQQYSGLPQHAAVKASIEKLGASNTYTITTAHQPALFTGTLYFVYKILHVIKLAELLTAKYPTAQFVPVYWMGSEDADLEELGKFYLSGEKITWNTQQTGAVGKMNTRGIEQLIERISGELSVLPHGKTLVALLQDAYLNAPDLQTATFRLLHQLFAHYGLVVLIPDSAGLKQLMQPVFEADLFQQEPSAIVSASISQLGKSYKVQANPREINLFYFKDSIRARIIRTKNGFEVFGTDIRFDEAAMRTELELFPERFSPNVILRGLYQETILPNIAFIGGGGETAYWLELKALFENYAVPYPMLILRNSFLLVEHKWQKKIDAMDFTVKDFFQSEDQLLTQLVNRQRNAALQLQREIQMATVFYQELSNKATQIDQSLQQHVAALQQRAVKSIRVLEKKLLRAEKRKFEAEQRHIHAIKQALFPRNGLQERIDNFMPYYAKWGPAFIEMLYQHSLGLEQQFGLLSEK